MEYHFTDEKPIYAQLLDFFKIEIISGERAEGSRVESVRELAVKAKVNPNTMQKALTELERIGLIKTERTSGRFVTDDKEKIATMRTEFANSEILAFLKKMELLGFNKAQVIKLIDKNDAENAANATDATISDKTANAAKGE
ncbi:MAG: GntR family transcriptional regulator [Treponema sp.]|nr:GntR family transcriptional regulator [Treponema sp.]